MRVLQREGEEQIGRLRNLGGAKRESILVMQETRDRDSVTDGARP